MAAQATPVAAGRLRGWSDTLPDHPPDERKNAPILPWASIEDLEKQLRELRIIG